MTAVPKAPEPKHLEIVINGDQLGIISKVRTFDSDIVSFQNRIKTLNEQIDEELENSDGHDEVVELEEKLKGARDNLKRGLMSNAHYNNLMEEVAQEKQALSTAQANMSDFLLAYFAETHEKQIELGPSNAREVVLKGRLGKSTDFQTNIFGAE